MLEALAELLRETRQAGALSLEAVARPARISAPYLLKLERGQVTNPSPRVLARLATVLGISYLRLMELAGYFDEGDVAAAELRTPAVHPLAGQQLTSAEWREVGAFIRRLIAQRFRPRDVERVDANPEDAPISREPAAIGGAVQKPASRKRRPAEDGGTPARSPLR